MRLDLAVDSARAETLGHVHLIRLRCDPAGDPRLQPRRPGGDVGGDVLDGSFGVRLLIGALQGASSASTMAV